MDTDQALDVARDPDRFTSAQQAKARTVLAAKVIAMREATTEVAATWQQYRDNAHVPPELRRVLDAFVAQRR